MLRENRRAKCRGTNSVITTKENVKRKETDITVTQFKRKPKISIEKKRVESFWKEGLIRQQGDTNKEDDMRTLDVTMN